MSSQKNRGLLASSAVAALLLTAGAAQAGGFAVREQSTEFQGMSFAGNAAGGGGLSGMFWNPAVAAYAPVGIYTESHYAAVIGRSEITGDLFTGPNHPLPGLNLGLPRESGDIAKDAIVPASYMSYRLSDKLVFAMSVNSPFGLVTEPSNRFWAGQIFARTSEIKTYNFSPTLAYRITPTLAIGVGAQIEHITGRLKSAAGLGPADPNVAIQGDDTAFGVTAGINWQPTAYTNIGLGYRSSIDHTLEGSIKLVGTGLGNAIKAGTTLPEIVTLSMRQGINERLTVLGTVEWTHWNRLQSLDVTCANQGPAGPFCPGGAGQLIQSLDLGWHDGWFFSLGAEYKYSHHLTLRGGVAYELSPIQNADERSLRVPDADRIWTSVGATYKWNDKMAFDLAYSHIFVGDAPINVLNNAGTLNFVGHADTSVDIISASLKIKLGGDAHYEPLK